MTDILHKLPEAFIITSDKKPKEGEDFLDEELRIGGRGYKTTDSMFKHCQKIIAQKDQIDFSALKEEEQKEIGWFDVEKLAESKRKTKYIDGSISNWTKNDWQSCYKEGFIEAFQKAQELLSDRRFSLEDMKLCYMQGWNRGRANESTEMNSYIQSISKKSWILVIFF
jgi:hypothetical protein